MHRLTVRVNRPDVEVRARSGYEMPRPVTDTAKRASSAAAAIAGPVPVGDLPLRLQAVPLSGSDETSSVAIVIGVDHPGVAERRLETFDIEIRAFGPAGERKGQWRHTATATLRPNSDDGPATFDLLAQILLPPGRYELRVGVASRGLGLYGSVYGDVALAEMNEQRLSVIGPVLSVAPPVPAAPAGLLNKWLPVTPTARRIFSPRDRVTAWFRVSLPTDGPRMPVDVAARVVGTAGDVVFETARTIAAQNLESSHAGYQVSLPVRMPPGSYVLHLTTSTGRDTVQHEISFVIR